jgi:hypothetical protein
MSNNVTATDRKPDEGGLVTERENRDSFNLGSMKEMDNNQETRRNVLREIE